MKKILLTTAAVLISASAASAADLAARPYTKAPAYAPPAPIYNWTGFYIGGHIGGAFGGEQQHLGSGFVANNNDGGFMGGVQVGYDYAVLPELGVRHRGQLQLPRHQRQQSSLNRGLGSVTGRLGYTWGPALLYVKGGYGWADSRFTNGFGADQRRP